MTSKLFEEFQPVSAKAFKQKIQFDLDGAEYNKTLVWHTPEGIDVKPFYHREETTMLEVPAFPKTWKIGEETYISNTVKTVEKLNDLAVYGVEAICLKADKKFDIPAIFSAIPVDFPIYLNLSFFDTAFAEAIQAQSILSGHQVFLNIDPIGRLAADGNWFDKMDKDLANLGDLLSSEKKTNTISIDVALFQNAGATIVQQLAYALAQANEYLNRYGKKTGKLTFTVAVGSNYFFEIAKLRALRILYATLAKEYNAGESCHIVARPTLRNKTIYDYNTNLLRTTTECMSAILGGADTVLNLPYDYIYHKTNDFGQRISRNQLLILKEESYFDTLQTPARGSYYIEGLTQQFADRALALFKEIETGGGFLAQLKPGLIQKKIKESAAHEQQLFDKQEKVLLGTNKHPNPDDRMKDNLELYPFVKTKPRKTLLEPIIPRRLAENIEKQRLEKEI
ncbi:MAG: methylmalonyl-CoA mutase [Cytophagaceae bacterium]|nr:methylmalonyl-CoA mutase [Cytophagaceae bacterium]|tara:strand:- start:8939 stop:10294 length:1356 start_codon:yes stop_codon:yes gene_type:complete